MFYETSIVNNLLKCHNITCNRFYNDKNEPHVLPCCVMTVWSSCSNQMQQEANNNKLKYHCIICNTSDLMPSRGFPINQLAISLMLESPKEIYRNESCEILKKSLSCLEELNQTFLHEFCNAESTFDSEF